MNTSNSRHAHHYQSGEVGTAAVLFGVRLATGAWLELVRGARIGDAAATAKLQSFARKVVLSLLAHSRGRAADERHANLITDTVLMAARSGRFDSAYQMIRFARTLCIEPNHFDTVQLSERVAMTRADAAAHLASILRELSVRERKMLTRYYMDHCTTEEVCAEFSVTPSQLSALRRRVRMDLHSSAVAVQHEFSQP